MRAVSLSERGAAVTQQQFATNRHLAYTCFTDAFGRSGRSFPG